MYLPLRHGKVAKVIYDAIIDCNNQKIGIVDIYIEGNKENNNYTTFKTQQTRHSLLE